MLFEIAKKIEFIVYLHKFRSTKTETIISVTVPLELFWPQNKKNRPTNPVLPSLLLQWSVTGTAVLCDNLSFV